MPSRRFYAFAGQLHLHYHHYHDIEFVEHKLFKKSVYVCCYHHRYHHQVVIIFINFNLFPKNFYQKKFFIVHFLFYCRVLRFVGPFVLMIYTIIAKDLSRFIVIYSIFVVGFSQSINWHFAVKFRLLNQKTLSLKKIRRILELITQLIRVSIGSEL